MSLQGLQLGRYRLLNMLGSGGMGEVYLAEDLHIRRQVALKVIRSEATAYPNAQEAGESERLFRREVKAIAMLDHPHILPLFDYGTETVNDSIYTYMVMPLRREGSLATWLRQRGDSAQLTPAQVAHFVQQAAEALQYAHHNQIIHQDVKPSNFLIRHSEVHPDLPGLLLGDCGIAKFHTATASMSQTSRGTPTYMAPEHWSGDPPPASDQYALAIMAYQLLTGHPPFEGRQEQVMYQHFQVTPKAPSSINTNIPHSVDEVLLRALAKTPQERYPSISAFSQALQSALQPTMNPASEHLASVTVSPTPPVTPSAAPITPPAPLSPSSSLHNETPHTPSGSQVLRATLAISEAEASSGTMRTLTLPGGKKVAVSVPANVADGYTINMAGPQPGETLAVTIAIKRAEDESRPITQSAKASDKTYLSSPLPTQAAISSPAPSKNRTPVQRFKLQHIGRTILLVVLAIALIGFGTYYFTSYNYLQRTRLLGESMPNPYPPNTGMLALNDPLTDNNAGYSWGTGSTTNGNCAFTDAALHVKASKQGFYVICSAAPTFRNFVFEVRMTIKNGDFGGIAFRGHPTTSQSYAFILRQDGNYIVSNYTDVQGTHHDLGSSLNGSPISNFNKGPGQSNLVAVVANGNQISLFVNNVQVTSVTDSTYSQGQIGVFADDEGNATDVAFSDAKVWTF